MLVNTIAELKAILDDTKARRNLFILRLYTNDHTPAWDDEAADYTEATFSGYAPQFTTNWGDAYENDDNEAQSDEQIRGWLVTLASPGQQVYGYYLTDVDGILRYAERNPTGPVSMAVVGEAYVVFPRVTERNQA